MRESYRRKEVNIIIIPFRSVNIYTELLESSAKFGKLEPGANCGICFMDLSPARNPAPANRMFSREDCAGFPTEIRLIA